MQLKERCNSIVPVTFFCGIESSSSAEEGALHACSYVYAAWHKAASCASQRRILNRAEKEGYMLRLMNELIAMIKGREGEGCVDLGGPRCADDRAERMTDTAVKPPPLSRFYHERNQRGRLHRYAPLSPSRASHRIASNKWLLLLLALLMYMHEAVTGTEGLTEARSLV
jgi:hypothetical protein